MAWKPIESRPNEGYYLTASSPEKIKFSEDFPGDVELVWQESDGRYMIAAGVDNADDDMGFVEACNQSPDIWHPIPSPNPEFVFSEDENHVNISSTPVDQG